MNDDAMIRWGHPLVKRGLRQLPLKIRTEHE